MWNTIKQSFWYNKVFGHTCHASTGLISGLTGCWILTAAVCVRQCIGFQEKQDTPSEDLAFHLAGLVAGILIRTLHDSKR